MKNLLLILVLASCVSVPEKLVHAPSPYLYGNNLIKKDPGYFENVFMESTPVVFNDELLLVGFERLGSHGETVKIYNYATKDLITEHEFPYGLGCAIVVGSELYIFGTSDWSHVGNHIGMIKTSDLVNFTSPQIVVPGSNDFVYYNSSVAYGPLGFVISVETSSLKYYSFTPIFFKSEDLVHFTPFGKAFHDDIYAACPTIRYVNGYYQITYLQLYTPVDGELRFVTTLSRTKDFVKFEDLKGDRQVISSRDMEELEGTNNSDFDFVEFNGKVYATYIDGDQVTWGGLKTASFDGTLSEMFTELWRD